MYKIHICVWAYPIFHSVRLDTTRLRLWIWLCPNETVFEEFIHSNFFEFSFVCVGNWIAGMYLCDFFFRWHEAPNSLFEFVKDSMISNWMSYLYDLPRVREYFDYEPYSVRMEIGYNHLNPRWIFSINSSK